MNLGPKLRAATLAMALAALPCTPAAEPLTTISGDVYARAGPLGVMALTSVSRRWDEPDGDGFLDRGRYAQAFVGAGLSPSYAQASIGGEWVPLAPLQLGAQYDAFGYFGAYTALLRFPSPDAPFRDPAKQAGPASPGVGHRLLLYPTLRAQAGPFVVRSRTEVALYALARGEGWYYESGYDTLVASRDLVLSNQTVLLVRLWRRGADAVLLAGPSYEVTWAARADLARQRWGGVLFLVPADRVFGLDRPRLFAYAGVNVVDRNRQGDVFAVMGVGADVGLRRGTALAR